MASELLLDHHIPPAFIEKRKEIGGSPISDLSPCQELHQGVTIHRHSSKAVVDVIHVESVIARVLDCRERELVGVQRPK